MQESLLKLFCCDLEKLKTELLEYSDESNIWKTNKNISNSAGNLALHVVGNLNHYIGSVLGNTGYIRQRDLEFSLKNIAVSDINNMIDDTISVLSKTTAQLTNKDLQNEYKRSPFDDYTTTEYFLLHLKSHLAYHLGQINYHRRFLD